MKRNWIIIALLFFALPMMAQDHQTQVVDKVVAVVGKNIILQSDIENQYIQYRVQGMAEGTGKEVRSRILEDLLLQKLMLNQAEMDSITVTDDDVERQMDQKLHYFISRFGSQEKMEAQFGKTLSEIKDELNRITSADNVKHIFGTDVFRMLTEKGYVKEQQIDGRLVQVQTDSGLEKGITAAERTSKTGTVYTVLMYPEAVQKEIVEHYTAIRDQMVNR